MESKDNWNEQAAAARADLQETLAFWWPAAVSPTGGFGCYLDREGKRYDTDKGVWHQGRFAWLLGTVARCVEDRAEWRSGCELGVQFLLEHCIDPTDGRYWFQLDGENRPLRKRRYAFSEAFAAQAYGASARLTGNGERSALALRTFDDFLARSKSPDPFPPKWTETRPMRGIGVPMIAIGVAQALRGLGEDERLDALVDRCVEEIERDFVKADMVLEAVGEDGSFVDSVEGRTLNPGHAIEAAWFLMREGRERQEGGYVTLGLRILELSWDCGWDTEHGGLLSLVDALGKPVQEYWHDMKFWWPHNEAAIATLMAFGVTGEERWLERYRQVQRWSKDQFADPEAGEWFGYLHRDGSVASTAKGNLWKGPFHLPRAQLFTASLLQELAEGATPGPELAKRPVRLEGTA